MKYDPEHPFFFKPDPNGHSKMNRLLSKYEEKFHCGVPTEPSLFTEDEWCTILEECIRENETFEELTGFRYEEGCDY